MADSRLPAGPESTLVRCSSASTRRGNSFSSGRSGRALIAPCCTACMRRFQKILTGACPFSNLPEKHGARYGQAITAAEMRRCRWVEPNIVCQVKFSEWTRDNRLRQPVFLGLREDKTPTDVVREESRRAER